MAQWRADPARGEHLIRAVEVDNLSAPLRPADERAIRAILERLFRGLGELWAR